jgi:hypothetical protein
MMPEDGYRGREMVRPSAYITPAYSDSIPLKRRANLRFLRKIEVIFYRISL